jgi:pSer/pThr/pTyr-binding forkhead associated (FHA) protein
LSLKSIAIGTIKEISPQRGKGAVIKQMKTAPVIIVQLIHIEGPLKGQIVELSDPEIKIGRHPSCQLRYPADLAIISREHALITREGNRFKLTDQSSNGTIVNGKRITEVFLKDGDVITVSEGGPKVSFLTQMTDTVPPPQENIPSPVMNKPKVQPTPQTPRPPQPPPVAPEPKLPQKNKAPLIIQYGPTLRSFDELPLKIGKHPSSEFILEHANILDLHAEIYFADGQYFIRDLTGSQMITTNGSPVGQGSILQKDDLLALSQSGPFFRFLGNGRLSEEEIVQNGQEETGRESVDHNIDASKRDGNMKNPLSFLKRLLTKP